MKRAFVLSALVASIVAVPETRYCVVNAPLVMASVLVASDVARLAVGVYAARTTATLADLFRVAWPLMAVELLVLIAAMAITHDAILSGLVTALVFGAVGAAFFAVALIGAFLFVRAFERGNRREAWVAVLVIAAGLAPTLAVAGVLSLFG